MNPKWTPAQRQKIADLYGKHGVETNDIQSRFGIGCVALYEILAEFDVPRRKGRPGHP